MPAILRRHVDFKADDETLLQPAADGRAALAATLRKLANELHAEADKLDGGDLLTTAEAASLCGRSAENMRQWCRAFGIGEFDPRVHCYLISRAKLRAHLLRKYGRLPHALAADFEPAQHLDVVSN
jgi:hypothetical protein